MKKLAIWSVMALIALSLTACASGSGSDTVRVKCPSCGYQFDAEQHGS